MDLPGSYSVTGADSFELGHELSVSMKDGKCSHCSVGYNLAKESVERNQSIEISQQCSKGTSVPLQVWNDPEGSRKLRFPDFMTTAQDSGKVVSITHRSPLPPANTPGTHFCQRLIRPQGHSVTGRIYVSEMTLAGIEPATFRFVAQYLNHCATATPVSLSNQCLLHQ